MALIRDTDVISFWNGLKRDVVHGAWMYIGLGVGAFMDGKVCCIGNRLRVSLFSDPDLYYTFTPIYV